MQSVLPHTEAKDLHELLSQGGTNVPQTQFELALGIWSRRGLDLTPNFLHIAHEQYQAAAETLDFIDREKAVTQLNAWVSEHTHGKIPDLFSATTVP